MVGIKNKANHFDEYCGEDYIKDDFSLASVEQAKTALNMRIAARIGSRLYLRGKAVFTFCNVPIKNVSIGNISASAEHYEVEKTD
ncbi:MAG: hypothetical protein A2Y15_00890 [Clostridiales bacterium GWF2_36_10]|nr:MAG: hypothetical protein A2Y15_00890 [Clostridiales bacterium GWF2_36_10]